MKRFFHIHLIWSETLFEGQRSILRWSLLYFVGTVLVSNPIRILESIVQHGCTVKTETQLKCATMICALFFNFCQMLRSSDCFQRQQKRKFRHAKGALNCGRSGGRMAVLKRSMEVRLNINEFRMILTLSQHIFRSSELLNWEL